MKSVRDINFRKDMLFLRDYRLRLYIYGIWIESSNPRCNFILLQNVREITFRIKFVKENIEMEVRDKQYPSLPYVIAGY